MPPPSHATILAVVTPHPSQSEAQAQSHPSYNRNGPYNANSNLNATLLTSKYSPAAAAGATNTAALPALSSSDSGPSIGHNNYASAAGLTPPAFYYHYNNKGRGTSGSVPIGSGSSSAFNVGAAIQQDKARAQQQTGETLSVPRLTPANHDSTGTTSSFAPGALPNRTSSLLPPPRNVHLDQDPSSLLDPLTKTSRRPHSRSSSIGAASDSFRNLNRWSASTASSRASIRIGFGGSGIDIGIGIDPSQQQARQQVGASFARRMSVDSIGILSQAADHTLPQSGYNSPRKLIKRRPSLITSPRGDEFSAATRPRQRSSPPAPPPNLPPIIALPSLELPTNTLSSDISRTESPVLSLNRASPATTTPNSIFSLAVTEPQDYFPWDETTAAADSAIPSPATTTRGNTTPGLSPSPIERDAMPEARGHTRNRSSAAKGSIDSTKSNHRSKLPSQKAMLSRALAKANTAVQLDNAQNFEGARQSYAEACDLLRQVLSRTTGEEDQRKLEAIRQTYTSRIEELDEMMPPQSQGSKALPARPESGDYYERFNDDLVDDDEKAIIEQATIRNMNGSPGILPATRYGSTTNLAEPQQPLHSSFNKSPMRRNFEGANLDIPRPEPSQLMPAPLSPRRIPSPTKAMMSPESAIFKQDFSMAAPSSRKTHSRKLSHESISWLDPIEESGGSAASSVHSRTSSFGVRRKHIRAASGDTEAEFDAALDAAVEAAYDDGYEPMSPNDTMYDEEDDIVANALRKVELAKERVRETEREAAVEAARESERLRQTAQSRESQVFGQDFYNGNSSDEEEERVLEQMTRNYIMNDFDFGVQPQPQSSMQRERESDSSGITHRTWHSSMGSNPTTGTTMTALSPVTEVPPPSKPTPSAVLPPPPEALPPLPMPNGPSSVRNRRLSGQNLKQLKIETSKIAPPPGIVSAFGNKPASYIAQQRQALSATTTRPMPFSMRAPSSPGRGISPAPAVAPPSPPHTHAHSDEVDDIRTLSPSSSRPALRKNQSSSSLKSLKGRQLSISAADGGSEASPHTPLSYTLTNNSTASRQTGLPPLPTPMVGNFGLKPANAYGGLYLFDSDFHSPAAPLSPSLQNPDAPVPLEPCPSECMLRPFWLMRALYQTLCHPRGGYITNRLFVPRDVWKVKGVKLRSLEDKTFQCDMLTAALLKLARVDSNDADAVLEEMQSFENILESVQNALTRRLGNEVGTQGIGGMADVESLPAVPRSASVSGKGGAFSWRRLRNKGSAVNLTNAYGGKSNSGGSTSGYAEKEVLSDGSLASLPMTANPSSRQAKRDPINVKFDGPYAGYMASLARLFDAAQTVDQIARQVEDPGLRHADKTQVGLELCTRHAAEFFGFYICRFVLADLNLLLDKFVKRGSEWVLN